MASAPYAVAHETAVTRQIVVVFLIGGVIALPNIVRFVLLGSGATEPKIQSLQLLLTLCFTALSAQLCRLAGLCPFDSDHDNASAPLRSRSAAGYNHTDNRGALRSWPMDGAGFPKLSSINVASLAGIISVLGSGAVLSLSSDVFAHLGYSVSGTYVLAVVGAVITMMAFAAQRGSAALVLVVACLGFLLLNSVSIINFPLNPVRSDMLPLISEAVERFSAGSNPYTRYAELNDVPLTYLPGLWISFLPGALAGIDPRWTVAFALIAAVAIAYHTGVAPQRAGVGLLLAVFTLNPYLVFRHETYIHVYILTLAVTFFGLRRCRPMVAGIAFGWSMATSQLSWVLFPVLATYVKRRGGSQAVISFAASAALLAGTAIVPFLIASPGFFSGVFLHWQGRSNLPGLNLTYWVAQVTGPLGVYAIQFASVIACWVLAFISSRTLSECLVISAITLFCFVLLNQVIWMYFFPVILFILVVAIAVNEEAAEDSLVRRCGGTTRFR